MRCLRSGLKEAGGDGKGMVEEWKDIVGFGGVYQISDHGNVRSFHSGEWQPVRPGWCGSTDHKYDRVWLHGPTGRIYPLVHRLVAAHFVPNAEGVEMVDHIDGDSRNNHVSNLRWATRQQNNINCASRRGSSSAYKGVSWHKPVGKWVAQIQLDGRQHHLGCFDDERDAARAYNEAARRLHGDFARLNVIPDDEPST